MKFPIITETRTIQIGFDGLPEWMMFALKGQKINAIKSLREITVHQQKNEYEGTTTPCSISLIEAKMIVENLGLFIKEEPD